MLGVELAVQSNGLSLQPVRHFSDKVRLGEDGGGRAWPILVSTFTKTVGRLGKWVIPSNR